VSTYSASEKLYYTSVLKAQSSWINWDICICQKHSLLFVEYSPNSITRLSPKLPREESHGHKIMKVANTNGGKSWSFGQSRRYKSRKSRTQTISTCRDVCNKVGDKPVCVALMEFSPLQCTEKVGGKVWNKFLTKSQTCHGHKSWKSATWFVLQTFMICVRNFVGNLSRTLSQNRRNGIWA